jgi:Zn ribbon nucleic-acid-binding protein
MVCATLLQVGKSEELRSCVCCGHATRKTDELGE